MSDYRHDYGPRGCCVKKGAQLALIMGAGAWLIGLGGKAGWHATTWVLRRREARR